MVPLFIVLYCHTEIGFSLGTLDFWHIAQKYVLYIHISPNFMVYLWLEGTRFECRLLYA
jgi:hypothetical protein